jgi:aspartate racemase
MAKTIGLVGGMTPESTVSYYEEIIQLYEHYFDDYAFPEIIVYSVSFQSYVDWMYDENWQKIADSLSQIIASLYQAGADFALLATNTMHNVFSELAQKASIPLLSIIDATAEVIVKKDIHTVGLLGTRFTMQKTFYKNGLNEYNINTLVPEMRDQKIIDQVIFEELGKGIIRKESKEQYLRIIDKLYKKGAQGIVLGCTEIPLLLKQDDCAIPLFNTTQIHAEKAFTYAMGFNNKDS